MYCRHRPGIALRLDEKTLISKLLDDLGVYEIEAGIPALCNIEADCIKEIMKVRKQAKISVWSRMVMSDIRECIACSPDIIHIGAPVSYVQIYKKLNKNKSWVQKTLLEVIEKVQDSGIQVTVGFEDASRADIGFMAELAKMLKQHNVNVIRLADTVGVFYPSRVGELVERMIELCDVDLELHMHNDLGMAVANSIEGTKAGAKYIDCTLFGIGERSGNCNIYDYVKAAGGMYDFNISLHKIVEVENEVRGYLMRSY